MNEVEQDRHPDAELLAAFVDGTLMGNELTSVARHLRTCTDCREAVGETARFRRENESAVVVPMRPRANRWWLAVAAAAAIAIAIIPLRSRFTDPLTRIQAPDRRSTEARLIGLDYAPYRPTRSGTQSADSKRLGAAAQLQEKVETTRSAENLDHFARAELSLGHTDSALELLNEASRLQPNDAVILNDLAAAQLTAGKTADAAENAARALDRDPTLAPAAFNWALALEQLSNRPAAIAAWEKYLKLDSTSEWAVEAREHLNRLRAPRADWQRDSKALRPGANSAVIRQLVERYPHRVRNWMYDELLPRYIESRRAEDLDLGGMIAESRATAGDLFLRDLLDHTRSMPSGNADFANGMRAFTMGRNAAEKHDIDVASASFKEASALLRRVRSPLVPLSNLFAATNDFYGGKSDAALSLLSTIDDRYPSIAAETRWVRGLILARLGHPNESLQWYESAIEYARRCKEIEDEIAISTLVASLLERIGDPAEAERYRLEVLRRLDETASADQRTYSAFSQTVYRELAAHRPHVALAFIDAQSSIARRENDPLMLAETDAQRALAYCETAQPQTAIRAIQSARDHAAQVKNAGMRDRVRSDIDFIDGTTTNAEPAAAITALGSSIETWQKYHWKIRSARGHLARGKAYLRIGNPAAAEIDFRTGINEMEQQRGELDEPLLRVAYFERADALFERLITLLLDQNRDIEALSIAERKRARLLLDEISRTGATSITASQPLDGEAIAGALNDSAAVVEYALLEQRVAIWCIAGKHVWFASTRVTRDEVESAIRRHLQAIRTNDLPAIRTEGRWLFDRLLEPVRNHLESAQAVVIVPDGILNALPFATLTTPQGTYLVESRAVATAPSASSFIDLMKKGVSRGNAVIIAQSAPWEAERLAEADDEVRQIAPHYEGASLFIGRTITPDTFLQAVRNAGVIHFAGHAIVDAQRPARSALLFETSVAPGLPRVDARQIAQMRFSYSPLVVLAACGTGNGKVRQNEGIDSLATAFLYAGARGVVATLWDVDDRAASRLFVEFHTNRQRGQSDGEALRNAQLSLLNSNKPSERLPAQWGATVIIGIV